MGCNGVCKSGTLKDELEIWAGAWISDFYFLIY